MREKTEQYDIVIAGAGLVGLSFALSAHSLGLSIAILETHLPDMLTETKTHSRPISLSYGSYRILNALGVWGSLADLASPILSVHVSEKGKLGFTRFSAEEENVPALGFVVPFTALQKALYHAVAAQSAISLVSIKSIQNISRDKNGADISITTSGTEKLLHAKLFVAADGTGSTCRNLLHIPADEKESDDIADIYHLTLSEAHDHTAYERFTREGVFAVLPLRDGKQVQLVWTRKEGSEIGDRRSEISKKQKHEPAASQSEECLLALVRTTFEGRLEIESVKKIARFPLKTTIAQKQITQSAVLLGNAAHTIYPVAAQGFNLGLHDINILNDVLRKALQNNKMIGDITVLEEYESTARVNQEKIFRITNTLTPLFDFPLIGGFRGLGLLSMDLLKPIKNRLAKRTMGIVWK